MMYLGDQAVGLANSYNKKVLLYKNNTFGNVWTEYQPVDIDYENNAIVLDNAAGLPTELSNNGTAYIQVKPYVNAQYGTIPTEYYNTGRLKAIGNNKVELYNSSGQLLVPTDTSVVNLSNVTLLYRASTTISVFPQITGLPHDHYINIKLFYNGIFGGASGIQALDSDGQMIRGTSYGQQDGKFKANGVVTKPDGSFLMLSGYDGYGCIAGNRTLIWPLGDIMRNAYGYFDVLLSPEYNIGKCLYDINSLHITVDSRNKTNWFDPRRASVSGYINKTVDGIKLSVNSPSIDWYGPNSVLEVWDCGPVN